MGGGSKIVYNCQVDPRPVICFLIIPRRFREHLKEDIFQEAPRKSRNKIKVGGGGWFMEELRKLSLLPYCCFCISRCLFAMNLFFTYLHFNPWNTQVNPFVSAGAQPGLNCHQPQPPADSSPPLTSRPFSSICTDHSRMVSDQ